MYAQQLFKPELMKLGLLLLLLLFFNTNARAQNELSFTIKNTKGKVLGNIEITAINQSTNTVVSARTDASGTATLTLSEPGMYSLSYLDQKNFDTYEVKEGFRSASSQTLTYDPEGHFKPKEKPSRANITFANISSRDYKDKAGTMLLTLTVVTKKKAPVSGVSVTLVSLDKKFKMTGVSNGKGEVIFHVPVSSSYEVDVDGIESLKTVKTPNAPKANITHFVFYEKLEINEIAKGDTLIQQDITQIEGTNTHVLFSLKLLDYDGEPLEGEPVYMKAENGTRIYETVTNSNGECKLMLKKDFNYILNLKYEEGLHLAEMKNSVGFGQESLTRRYRGSAEIERILAEQKAEMKRQLERAAAEKIRLEKEAKEREEQIARMSIERAEREKELAKARIEARAARAKSEKGLVQDFYNDKMQPTFRETPVRTAARPQNYKVPNAQGYTLQFKSSGPIGTPTIVDDNICLPAGHYSSDFYSLDAKTGDYNWGVQLGESGASPAVHSNGVLLINTYSCTLYAIDVNTGALLWSKWLAGTVYSTPTADDDRVYVVFKYGGAYVTSCFDLRTGAFKWINRVDSRAIACPVVSGNEVHVASQSGFYYIFDKETGKPIDVITSIDAVSSPTITEKSIYLTATIDGKDRLVEIDRKSKKITTFDAEIDPVKVKEARGSAGHMNFNGSHPIVYKNKYVIMTDRKGLKVFDATTEKMLWEKPVSVATSQVPIVADDKIYLATSDGKFVTYDIRTGADKSLKKHDGIIDAQPVYYKGFLFVVSAGILTAIRSVHDFPWTQWNKDSRHNLNIE